MRILSKLLDWLERGAEGLTVAFIIAMAAGMFAGVIFRYFVGSSIPFLMVILTGMFIWIVFLLIGATSRRDEQVRIGFLVQLLLKGRAQSFWTAVENIVSLPVLVYLTWAASSWVKTLMEQDKTFFLGATVSYPAWIPVIIVPIGFGIGSLVYLERSIKQARSLIRGRRERKGIESDGSGNAAGLEPGSVREPGL